MKHFRNRSAYYHKTNFGNVLVKEMQQLKNSSSPWADTFFWFHSGGKTEYGFLVTSGCLLFRKVWWVVQIGSFWPKIEVFYRPEWTKWKHLTRPFTYMYVNCFNPLRSHAEVSRKLQKMLSFRHIKGHNSGKELGN